MASTVCRFGRLFLKKNTGFQAHRSGLQCEGTARMIMSRNAVSSTSGGISPKPVKVPFGLIRMTLVVLPFLYVGTLISKNFAALLEEHDIFVPSDDDDDD
ncbi:single-pass membrane protein with aspartate-rich tail 1b [Clupea harengus]|uniref:Essential MCU regulator, mitochondrial n=1 Tax=Clupea harengus TaxID=7950 RepID=A0A6P8F4H7_CLUHA|nr:single-pass membrane protein with aspartate-rich tail 1b [Clupea harengus]